MTTNLHACKNIYILYIYSLLFNFSDVPFHMEAVVFSFATIHQGRCGRCADYNYFLDKIFLVVLKNQQRKIFLANDVTFPKKKLTHHHNYTDYQLTCFSTNTI